MTIKTDPLGFDVSPIRRGDVTIVIGGGMLKYLSNHR